jgi:hypothetical protein
MVDLNSFRREFLSASEFSDRAFNEMDVLTPDQYWMRARDRAVKKLVEKYCLLRWSLGIWIFLVGEYLANTSVSLKMIVTGKFL